MQINLARFGPYTRIFHRTVQVRSQLVPNSARVVLQSDKPIHRVSKRYASFSIDISVLVGGFWWEGSKGIRRGLGTLRVPALNLKSKRLDQLVKALGPSVVRVGGSEADKLHYFTNMLNDADALLLTKEIWDGLHAFIQRNELQFSFTFKYGLFRRHEHGEWNASEIITLLEYSIAKGYRLDVCELGNELNAYWAFHGLRSQPGPKNLAQDYARFANVVREFYPDVKVTGPGSAFWPKLGEAIKPFSNITETFLKALPVKLDIVDWHYYPFQSERSPVRTRSANLKSFVAPKSFETFARYSEKIRAWRDKYHPDAELWTGETGSAQCGGQPKLSDRFASSFWWIDQLGQGALLGQKVMIRQSLIGGDYGLIDRLTLKPRPDYWLTWLWTQLMGTEVLEVTSENSSLRCYCHKQPSDNKLTLVLINLSEFRIRPDIINFGKRAETYTVTARSLSAKKIKINGVRPKVKKGKMNLKGFPQLPENATIPASSINFWCFEI